MYDKYMQTNTIFVKRKKKKKKKTPFDFTHLEKSGICASWQL